MSLYLSRYFLNQPRKNKQLIVGLFDTVAVCLAIWLAMSLRLDRLYLPIGEQWWLFVIAPIVALPIFIKFGLYRAIIRYVGFKALWAITQAVLLYALIWSLIVLFMKIDDVPRSVHIINLVLVMLGIGGSRMVARWIFGSRYSRILGYDSPQRNVVIYGAGSAGMQLAIALSYGRELYPVAFIDDDKTLQHHQVNGLKIYPFSYLSHLIDKLDVEEVLLALPSATQQRRNEIITLLEPYPVHVRTIPGVSEIAQGKVKVEDIQEVDIEDLLGRDPVPPNMALLHANIMHKSVMVTGAGGSIGSELCRQILKNSPRMLILLEQSEFALYSIDKELRSVLPDGVELHTILGSVVNQQRLQQVLSAFRVNTIYHAAAYKHVPMVEYNPTEAVNNNILGTMHAAQAAIATKVETFVLISTDKAVRPTNTMGATKRFAELVLQALSQQKQHSTRFTMVRFGNVLGSSGSVVPLFRQQIKDHGPITVTDPKIIRYFMTIPEAAELVIQAGAMGKGGDVFVLDMGQPVKIVDLAKRMIRLSGLEVKDDDNPDGNIEITYTGLRPGEKLYEELLIGDNVSDTEHNKIMRAQEDVIAWPELLQMIATLRSAIESNDVTAIREVLIKAVSGFKPQCDIADEVWKAEQRLQQQTGNIVSMRQKESH